MFVALKPDQDPDPDGYAPWNRIRNGSTTLINISGNDLFPKVFCVISDYRKTLFKFSKQWH
jgi:hypothetical protein